MIWLGIAAGIALVLVGIGVVVRRARSDDVGIDDVDPLLVVGVSIMGAGAALATTVGPVMFVMMGVGLVAMAFGVSRTRHHRSG